MVVISLLTSVLLATAAFADPSSTTQAGARRKSQPFRNTKSNNLPTDGAPKVFYSSNWSGSAWNKSEPGTFTYVTGTFIAPKPKGPNGYASAWVGIDGFTCQTALLQTGISFSYTNGATQYAAWYEWWPADAYYFDLTINAGDEIQTSVKATSNTTGVAKVENLSTGKFAEINLNSTYALCGRNVEWIVEDFSYDNNTLVPFTNFGTVKFDMAYATMSNGEVITPDGADIIFLEQNKTVLTNVTEGVLTSDITYIAK